MNTRFEHVIGKDGLHRLCLTAANGEIIDNSHEGFSSHHEARQNLKRKLTAYLMLGGIEAGLAGIMASRVAQNIDASGVPIVDERDFHIGATGKTESLAISLGLLPDRDGNVLPREPEADPLRHARVFGKPANDPLEPQTPEN